MGNTVPPKTLLPGGSSCCGALPPLRVDLLGPLSQRHRAAEEGHAPCSHLSRPAPGGCSGPPLLLQPRARSLCSHGRLQPFVLGCQPSSSSAVLPSVLPSDWSCAAAALGCAGMPGALLSPPALRGRVCLDAAAPSWRPSSSPHTELELTRPGWGGLQASRNHGHAWPCASPGCLAFQSLRPAHSQLSAPLWHQGTAVCPISTILSCFWV